MLHQTTNHILMIRPVQFRFNEETAKNNFYQKAPQDIDASSIQNTALKEFDEFVFTLKKNGIQVTVIDDTLAPVTPDSIFPNNWVSFHQDGAVIKYPMYAKNRRLEKRDDIFETLKNDGLLITSITDYSDFEKDEKFLEGTGSLILDRQNKIIYAAESDRMHKDALEKYCLNQGYEPLIFTALQSVNNKRLPIYHTNVMMCLGSSFCVICLECIDNPLEKKKIVESLQKNEKEIIEITEDQVSHFAGNMLELRNTENQRLLIMSSSAFTSLSDNQKIKLNKHCQLIHSDLKTIEQLGGGSARCMMAEVFLPNHSTQLE